MIDDRPFCESKKNEDDLSIELLTSFLGVDKSEIESILNLNESEIFNYAFGVEKEGNAKTDPHGDFLGKNILFSVCPVKDVAKKFNMGVDQTNKILNQAK